MIKAETRKSWVEDTLETRLARVGAPAELWDRVVAPQTRVHTSVNAARMSACATVAVAIILLVIGFRPQMNDAGIQFRSSDPGAVRAWVNAHAGVDVPLHSGNLAGASVNQGRAAIAYRVAGRRLSLLVNQPASGRMSWAAAGQTYTLLCDAPEDLRACALCHLGS